MSRDELDEIKKEKIKNDVSTEEKSMTHSTLLTLSAGLELESPSHVNFTRGMRFWGTFRESTESRPESSFSCIDDEAELSVGRSPDTGHGNALPCKL